MAEVSNVRNGRPSAAYLSTLRRSDKHARRKLELACIQAIISDQVYITLVTSYLAKFPDDFPRATIEKSDGYIDVRRVNARQCLQWLNDKGYSKTTLEDLRIAKMKFTKGEYGVEDVSI